MLPRQDLFIHTDSEGYEPALITTDDPVDPVVISCSGIQALGGIVMRLLLTPKGSWPGDRSEGCELASLVGSVFDKTTFSAVASRSLIAVESTIKGYQASSSVPPKERLKRLELLSVDIIGDGTAVVQVLVTNYAGETTVVSSGR